MNRLLPIVLVAAAIVALSAVALYMYGQGQGAGSSDDHEVSPSDNDEDPMPDDGDGDGSEGKDADDMKLILTIDGKRVDVEWEDNPSVEAVRNLASKTLTVNMQQYGGFEQTGNMPSSIVSSDSWMSVGSGDIVLYRGVQICLYFDDNAYNFTRLGKMTGITDSEIRSLLDKPGVTAIFTLE